MFGTALRCFASMGVPQVRSVAVPATETFGLGRAPEYLASLLSEVGSWARDGNEPRYAGPVFAAKRFTHFPSASSQRGWSLRQGTSRSS